MPHAQLNVDDPFTLEAACTVDLASAADVDRVLNSATRAARDAKHTSIEERRALCLRALEKMEARTDEIAADVSRMMGKPLSQAKGELAGMAGRYRHLMEIAEPSLADIVLPKEGFDRRKAGPARVELPAPHRGERDHSRRARRQRGHRQTLPA